MISAIQQKANNLFLEACRKAYPDKQFRLVNGTVVTILEDPIVSLVDSSMTEQQVSGHYRRNKKGEIQRVRRHSKRKSMPTAMELAVAQAQQEATPLADINPSSIWSIFTKRISKPNSIGTIRG